MLETQTTIPMQAGGLDLTLTELDAELPDAALAAEAYLSGCGCCSAGSCTAGSISCCCCCCCCCVA